MINSVRLVNFKNFADETLKLGPFTVIVGANASGKSNIRDAFRFLHGIGRGYTLAEILGGKYGPGGQLEWEPIRGAPNEVVRLGTEPSPPNSTFSIDVQVQEERYDDLLYSIAVKFDAFGSDGFTIAKEKLSNGSEPLYDIDFTNEKHQNDILGLSPSRVKPNLDQWPLTYYAVEDEFGTVFDEYRYDRVISPFYQNIRLLELSPERMRAPSFPGATLLGDSGDNLPSVLEAICTDSQRGCSLMSWLQELTPMDVKDFDFPRDPQRACPSPYCRAQRAQGVGVQRLRRHPALFGHTGRSVGPQRGRAVLLRGD